MVSKTIVPGSSPGGPEKFGGQAKPLVNVEKLFKIVVYA